MTLGAALIGTLVGVPIYDWLSVTASAAKVITYEYQYWPFSRARMAGIAVLAIGLFTTLWLMHPPYGCLWIQLPGIVGLVFHLITMILDFSRQRPEAREQAGKD